MPNGKERFEEEKSPEELEEELLFNLSHTVKREEKNKIYEHLGEVGGEKSMNRCKDSLLTVYKAGGPEAYSKGLHVKETKETFEIIQGAFNKIISRELEEEKNLDRPIRAIEALGELASARSKDARSRLALIVEEAPLGLKKREWTGFQKKVIPKAIETWETSLLNLASKYPSLAKEEDPAIYEEMGYLGRLDLAKSETIKRLTRKVEAGFELKKDWRDDFKAARESLGLVLQESEKISENKRIEIYGRLAKAGDPESVKTLEIIRAESMEDKYRKQAEEILEDIRKGKEK